jgi:nicotinamidase-related amidase
MRRGLQPRKGSRGRAAVLALDLLSDFAFPDGPAVLRAVTRHSTAIRHLLDTARAHRVPVIYTNDNLGAWRSDSPALVRHCLGSGQPGADLVRSLAPQDSDLIVLKPRHSAFYGTPLEALLEDLRADTLILTGISAESCVWMTACDAHTRGFDLVIPADSLAGASVPALRRTLASLKDVLGARVPASSRSVRLRRGHVG